MKNIREKLEQHQKMAKKDWDELVLLRKKLKKIQNRISELEVKFNSLDNL